MASKVAASANKAGQAVDGIGDGADKGAQKFTRSQARVLAEIEKSTRALENLGKTASQRIEAKLTLTGWDRSAFEPALAKLREAEESTKRLALSSKDANESFVALARTGMQAVVGSAILATVKSVGQALFEASAQAERFRTTLNFATGGRGAQEIDYLRRVTQELGLQFSSTAQAYSGFQAAARGTALEGQKAKDVFESIAKASAVMGLSAEQSGGVLLALQQMISKGTVQAEELRGQLGERLPGAFQIAAKAMGVTTAELGKMLEQGQVVADDFLPKFAKALEENLGGAAEKAATRLDAAVNRFDTAWERLKQNAGDSGSSNFIADQMSSAAGALDYVSVAMEKARKDGGGFASQMLAAASAMHDMTLVGKRTEQNMYDNAKATAEAQKKLEELQKRAATEGTSAWLLKEIGQTNRYIATLQQARRERDALEGKGTPQGDPRDIPATMTRGASYARWAQVQKESEQKMLEIRMRQSGVNKQYLQELKDLEQALARQVITQDEYIQRVSKLATDTYKASTAGKDAAAALRGTGKAAKESGDAFAAQRDAAKTWAATLQKAEQGIAGVENKTLGLNAAQAALVEYLTSPAYKINAESQREMALASLYAWDAAIKHADALAEEKKAIEAADKAIGAWTAARQKDADTLDSQLQAMRDEIDAIGMTSEAVAELTAKKHELAAATEEEYAANLRAASAYAGEYKDAYEQAARDAEERARKLREKAGLERTKGEKKAAKEAEDAWNKSAQDIERALTDSLFRAFESGKDFGEALADTLKATFNTLVLRPIISAVMQPVSMLINGAVQGGLSAMGLGSGGALGAVGNVASIAGLAGSAGMFGAGLSAGFSGLMGGLGLTATGTTLGGTLSAGMTALGAGNIAGGLGTLAGALGPIAIGIGALVAIAQATKGETRTGGQFVVARDGEVYNQRRDQTYTYIGQQYDRDFSGGARNPFVDGQAYRTEGDPVDGAQESAIKKAVAGTADAITNILKTLGSEAVVTGFWAGLETSGKGRGGVYAGGSLSTGAAFGETGQGDNYAGTLYEKFSSNSPDFKEALENFTLDLKQATLQALQQVSDIPRGVQAMLKDVDIESLDLSAVDELLTKVADYPNQLLQAFGTTRDALVQTFTQGLVSGDAMGAGQAVADQIVGSIEAAMLSNAAGAVFDIVNMGIVTPMLDAIATGASVSEALSQASIDKAVQKATEAAQAFAAIWNDESFKAAMEQIRSTVGSALGTAGAAMQYQPRYIQQPARELTQAADAAAKAAEDAKKKWEELWKSLRSDRDSAEIDLLRAMGEEEAALARERARAIEGMDAEQAAYWDGTRAILRQVAELEKLNALRDEETQLQIELLQARGDEAGAMALITKGMSDAERAAYLYNVQLRKQVDAVQALTTELPALLDKLATPAQRQAMGYERIAGDLGKAGIRIDAGTLAGTSFEQIMAAATAVYQMGETSDEMRLALVRAVSGLKDLRDAALDLQAAAARTAAAAASNALGARNNAGSLLDRIDQAMGGKGDRYSRIREAELWAAMQTASYQQQIELSGELTGLILDRYQIERDAARQQLDYAKQLKDYVAGLQIGNLSPKTLGEKLAEAERQYRDTLGLAQAGDKDAQGRLQGASNAYLELARQYYASGADYTAIFESVTGSLSGLGDSLMTDAERQLSVSNASLDELKKLTGVLEGAYAAAQQDYLAQQSLLSGQLAALQAIEGGTELVRDIVQGLPALLATQLQQQSQAAAGVIETALTNPIEIKPAGEDVPTTIVTPAPIDWSGYTKGNDALVAEVKALREEVKQLREERKAHDQVIVQGTVAVAEEHARRIVDGVGNAVQQGIYQASVSKEATYK